MYVRTVYTSFRIPILFEHLVVQYNCLDNAAQCVFEHCQSKLRIRSSLNLQFPESASARGVDRFDVATPEDFRSTQRTGHPGPGCIVEELLSVCVYCCPSRPGTCQQDKITPVAKYCGQLRPAHWRLPRAELVTAVTVANVGPASISVAALRRS